MVGKITALLAFTAVASLSVANASYDTGKKEVHVVKAADHKHDAPHMKKQIKHVKAKHTTHKKQHGKQMKPKKIVKVSNKDKVVELEGDDIELDAELKDKEDFEASMDLKDDSVLDLDLEQGEEADAVIDVPDNGVLDIDLDDQDSYEQSMDLKQNENLDETIDLPPNAESIRLQVINGDVTLDVFTKGKHIPIKAVPDHKKEVETPKKAEATELSVAAAEEEVNSWLKEHGKTATIVGASAAGVVAVVGIAAAVIASRKRAAATSLMLEEGEQNTESDEVDAKAEEVDELEVEDLEAQTVNSNDENITTTGVVEGSV